MLHLTRVGGVTRECLRKRRTGTALRPRHVARARSPSLNVAVLHFRTKYVRSHLLAHNPNNSNMLSLIAKAGNAARPRVASSLQIATMATHAGTVKWFNAEKGFGFITPDGGKADIFVHHTGILTDGFRSLAEEERVEFDTTEHNGKLKAINVTGPDGAQVKGAPKPRRDDNY